MSKFFSGVTALIVLASLLAFQNCGGKPQGSSQNNGNQSNKNITVTGTVVKAAIECQNFEICSVDNATGKTKCFLPVNIDQTLLNDGNVVKIDGVIRDDLVNICMSSTLQVNSATLVSGATVPPSSP